MWEQLSGFRKSHKTAGFAYLVSHAVVTRAALCKDLGISLPTAGKLVDAFLSGGLAVSLGKSSTEVGRPAEAVTLDARRFIHAGVILEGRFIRIGLVDMRGDIVATRLLPCPPLPPPEQIVSVIPQEIRNLWQELSLPKGALAGICVGMPGVYNTETRVLSDMQHQPDPVLLGPYLDQLAEACSCSVFADNAVNLCAIGELTSRKWPHMVYLSLGSTLGAAFILEKQLLRGLHYKSGRLEAVYANTAEGGHPVQLGQVLTREALCRRFSLVEDADLSLLAPSVKKKVAEYIAGYLDLFIANLGSSLDVDDMIIGGITASELGDTLMQALQTALDRVTEGNLRLHPVLSPDSDILGAARLALQQTVDSLLG